MFSPIKNGKKRRRYFFYATAVLLFCSLISSAQPTCSAYFDPAETCHREIQNQEFVFLGRVISIEKLPGDEFPAPLKVSVEVEAPLKGELARHTEFFLERRCFGEVFLDQRYIFTAERVRTDKFAGLFSRKWSFAIGDEYTAEEIKTILDEIRSVLKKVKQPRIAGSVIEQQNASSGGRFLIASTAIKKQFAPNYLVPLANIPVTAKRRDGKEFKTATGAEGGFVFKDLPAGAYEILANLPKEFDIETAGNFRFYEKDKKFVEINDDICTRHVIINAQRQGGIRLSALNASAEWAYVVVYLQRVGEENGKRVLNNFFSDVPKEKVFLPGGLKYDFDHIFKKVPVGPYVLRLDVTIDPALPVKTIYYPGTSEADKAAVIDVEAGKTSEIEMSLPELTEN